MAPRVYDTFDAKFEFMKVRYNILPQDAAEIENLLVQADTLKLAEKLRYIEIRYNVLSEDVTQVKSLLGHDFAKAHDNIKAMKEKSFESYQGALDLTPLS